MGAASAPSWVVDSCGPCRAVFWCFLLPARIQGSVGVEPACAEAKKEIPPRPLVMGVVDDGWLVFLVGGVEGGGRGRGRGRAELLYYVLEGETYTCVTASCVRALGRV